MTEFDACVAVLNGYRDNCRETYDTLRAELRCAKRDGWDEEAIADMRADMHDVATKRNFLDLILDNLEDAVRELLQADAMEGLTGGGA